MHIMSTNPAKTLVWKYDYDTKLWRHKQRTPNTNNHHMPMNETLPLKIFLRTPLATGLRKVVFRSKCGSAVEVAWLAQNIRHSSQVCDCV